MEIEVEIRAVGLNSDTNCSNPSNEASGVVTSVGSAVKDFVPGDHVVFLLGDGSKSCFRTVARLDQRLAAKVPAEMSFCDAAGLPYIFVSAVYGLGDVARLSADKTVLIHDGASALGQASIQYAKNTGATIFATVSTVEERKLLTSRYGLAEDHVFSRQIDSFSRGVMRCTHGAGADVVFDTLGGESLQESLACVAAFGSFLHVGKKDGKFKKTVLDLSAVRPNVTITNLDILSLAQYRPAVIKRLLTKAVALYTADEISQIRPLTIMNFANIGKHDQVLDNNGVGKVVFKHDPSDLISVIPDTPSRYKFEAEASYVLAGGLGGLGRSLARWMAARGAKSLVFLSRSGRVSPPVAEMLEDVKGAGCNAHILICDVANADHVKSAIENCAATLPPIKGCIQCSMTLRVSSHAILLTFQILICSAGWRFCEHVHE
jgi:NADPH:quinone reductase-like Zn-dependent oxidoreductase